MSDLWNCKIMRFEIRQFEKETWSSKNHPTSTNHPPSVFSLFPWNLPRIPTSMFERKLPTEQSVQPRTSNYSNDVGENCLQGNEQMQRRYGVIDLGISKTIDSNRTNQKGALFFRRYDSDTQRRKLQFKTNDQHYAKPEQSGWAQSLRDLDKAHNVR